MVDHKARMGRPPAPWVYEILNLNLKEKDWVDKNDLCELLGISVYSIKVFLAKLNIDKKYELDSGFIRAKYKYSDLKQSVKEYIAPWPLHVTKSK